MAQNGFYFNMQKCTSCKCCAIACKELHDLEVDYNYRKVTIYEGGSKANVWTAALSIACNHCAMPACASVCSVSAITKDDETGLVTINPEVCIGCRLCEDACPYGAPVFLPDTSKVNKCDGCIGFLNGGEQPICVQACSTRCLDFGDLEDLRKKYGSADLVSDVQNLPDSTITNPSLLILPRAEMA